MVEKEVSGLKLIGYSLAGEETVIAAPELNVCFDIGKAPREVISCDHLCISHGHPDHTAGLHYYFTQRWFLDIDTGTAYLPDYLLEPVQDLMRVWARIEGRLTEANLVVAKPGQDIPIRRDLTLRPFAVNHGMPTLGFSVIEVRHKLKPEFVGKTGPELVQLKKQKVEIEYQLEIPLIAYCGDTAAGDFLDLDHVRNAKILLLECTFIDEEHIGRAHAGKHFHLRDLPSVMARLRNQNIVLHHLTRRVFLGEARSRVKEVLSSDDYQRVSFLMDIPKKSKQHKLQQ